MSDFGPRCGAKTSTEQNEEAEPEWYKEGPTSPNDFIELHGFDGPTKSDQFGGVDGNTSGGGNSGASSNNSSPPAKSTPAKVTPSAVKNGKIFVQFCISCQIAHCFDTNMKSKFYYYLKKS